MDQIKKDRMILRPFGGAEIPHSSKVWEALI